ncbi:hypothetical protein DIPPA_70096 [Diplonema papillatum]|nr:hypothetical protein DIPPA_70096 [Diplonema papillatum]
MLTHTMLGLALLAQPLFAATTIIVELEDFSSVNTFAPFTVVSDSTASGGRHIVWPTSGKVQTDPDSSTSGSIAIGFFLTQTATVSLQARVDFPGVTDDSFFYKLDSGSWNTQNDQTTSGWSSMTLSSFSSVAAGDHTLNVKAREDGAKLDSITITASAGSVSRTLPDSYEDGKLLAFPGAEGLGRFASGGRGGSVYRVTNLNDAGSGSFRDAISSSNRIIVFAVAGVIKIESRLVFKSKLTVLGQTAPGGGITIYGDGSSFSGASNCIIRYIRIRMGRGGESGKDTISIADGNTIIFDHVSLSWGRDANFDLNPSSGKTIHSITLQDSIVAQGLQTHSTGGIILTEGTSVIRTLWTDNNSRNPKARGKLQFVNNVIFNWVVSAYILGDTTGRSDGIMQGNYFIAGPESGGGTLKSPTSAYHIYATGNYYDSDKDGNLDGRLLGEGDFGSATWESSPSFTAPSVPVLSAQAALTYVLANSGCSKWRDEVDDYLMDEVKSYGTDGETISNENELGLTNNVGIVPAGSAITDSDSDGMPDSWETANGLNPNSADALQDANNNGWLNIEEYANSLL